MLDYGPNGMPSWQGCSPMSPQCLVPYPTLEFSPAQAIFFTPGSIAPYNSFKYMGCMIVGITFAHTLLYFPMWCA